MVRWKPGNINSIIAKAIKDWEKQFIKNNARGQEIFEYSLENETWSTLRSSFQEHVAIPRPKKMENKKKRC